MKDHRVKVITKAILFLLFYLLLLAWINSLDNSDLLLTFLILTMMVPIFYLVIDRYKQKQHIDYLHQETLKSELNLLKSQINPHFFFNTLNNLYGLAVEKSDLTEEVIYKLSQMMRFTIYDGRKNTVSVKDEINYLENFIELHQIRYNHPIDIQFKKSIKDDEQQIPPLLFINLLENAFKHGIETQTESGFIHFNLTTTSQTILFDIKNNFNSKISIKKAGGIGIDNLKRRLELLFPNKHVFTRQSNNGIYESTVEINLT